MNIGSNVNCMWRIGASQIDRSTGMGNESYAAAHITMMGMYGVDIPFTR